MSQREKIEQKAEELIAPILEENQFELVDMEYVKEGSNYYLRAYIDKMSSEGITVEDCVLVSRAFEIKLDEEDFIQSQYVLEISSPGLGRPLKKERDFERSLGKAVDIKLYKAIEQQKEWNGILEAYDKESISITIENGQNQEFIRKDIAAIKLSIDF